MMRRCFPCMILIFVLCVSPGSVQNIFAQAQNTPVPKNIILIIGDGMGLAHVTAAKVAKGTLNLEQFKIVGLLTTHSVDQFLTSSGASTTALATGVNTLYDAVAIDPSGKPLKTVLEYAKEFGKGAGLVTTSSITDVTPACFVAHVPSRNLQSIIAESLVESGTDVLMGGGLGYFLPISQGGSYRRDDKNLLAHLAETHKIVKTSEEFRSMGTPSRVAALLNRQDLPVASLRDVSLPEMTSKAIEILSKNQNGFFLMVEGSQIDWASHHGYGEHLLQEMVDLDDTVGIAIEFAKRDGQTLVLVTSDHESGGYTILDGSVKDRKITKAVFLTAKHSAVMVPLFAYGPGSETFGGIHQNTFVGQTLIDYVKQSKSAPQQKN